jgi:3-oxoacyl-[acyl-carrier-protein] synthase III
MTAHPLWCDSMSLRVLGTGAALPGEPVSTEELLDRVDRRFGLSLRRTGMAIAGRLSIRTRHLCRDLAARMEAPRSGHRNPELAAAAVQHALAEAGLSPRDLSYLVGHTATPARLIPPNIADVAEILSYEGPFTEFRQACTGFASALIFAQGLLRAGAGPVAIVGSETGSVFFDPLRAVEDRGQLVNLVQMGDGAGAVVLARDDAGGGPHLSHVVYGHAPFSSSPGLAVVGGGSDLPTCDAGFPEFRHDFTAVRRSGLELLLRSAEAARRACGRPCDFILPHQANGRIDAILAGPLAVPPNRIIVTAGRTGNTGSAAIWLALAQKRRTLEPGQTVLALGAEATSFMFGGFRYSHA